MCDPFNTSTEAALWDERNDLDPFMAEHYATNAQHELDRLLTASCPDMQRLAHVRRLLGIYHALAALAQLPEDSDFEDKEIVSSEDAAFKHPDRAALMGSGGDGSTALGSSSDSEGRSVFANSRYDDGAIGGGNRSRSRESSVESIVREGDFDGNTRGQQQHADRVSVMQQHVRQPQTSQQQVHQQSTRQHWAPQPVYNPPTQQMIQYHQPPPQPMVLYQPAPQPISLYSQSHYASMAMAIMQNMQYTRPSNITFNSGPIYQYFGPSAQHLHNVAQPRRTRQNHGGYDNAYDEILNEGNGSRRARKRRRARGARR